MAAVIVKPSPVTATELADEAADEVVPPVVVIAMLSYLARDIEPKYPTAGETPLADCHAATAVLVIEPKYPVAPPE